MTNLKKISPFIVFLLAVFVCIPHTFAEDSSKVNINTATLEELTTLKGVGEKYAQKIIEYRESKGPFSKPEDILNIKGIGLKIFNANKDRITI